MADRTRARLLILAAAACWSLSALFTKLLTSPTPLGLHEPALSAPQITFWRAVFGGSALLPFLRRSAVVARPALGFTAVSFAAMSISFIAANALGSAGNAALLQYTAPVWLTLACVWLLREPVDRPAVEGMVLALAGVAVIVVAHWNPQDGPAVALALFSGLTFAGVLLGLRYLRDCDPVWPTVMNLGVCAVAVLPWVIGRPLPSAPQLVHLALFGTVQLALPYWLMARALRHVGAQEVGVLTLLEPVLTPVWPWLFLGLALAPSTWVGGALILSGLLWRLRPARRTRRE